MKKKPEFKIQNIRHPSKPLADFNDPLLRELVAHLRQNPQSAIANPQF